MLSGIIVMGISDRRSVSLAAVAAEVEIGQVWGAAAAQRQADEN